MVVNFLFTSIAAAAFNCINVCLSLQIRGTFGVTFIFYDVQRSSPFKSCRCFTCGLPYVKVILKKCLINESVTGLSKLCLELVMQDVRPQLVLCVSPSRCLSCLVVQNISLRWGVYLFRKRRTNIRLQKSFSFWRWPCAILPQSLIDWSPKWTNCPKQTKRTKYRLPNLCLKSVSFKCPGKSN